jgi:hypothetical protein
MYKYRGFAKRSLIAMQCVFLCSSAAAAAVDVVLLPTDDALVLTAPSIGAGFPSNRTEENRGGDLFLEAFAGDLPGGTDPTRSSIDFSFLKFDLSGISASPVDVGSIQLHIEATIVSASGAVSLFYVSDDSWTEGTGSSNSSINPSLDATTGVTGKNFGQPFLANLDRSSDLLATLPQPSVGEIIFDFSSFDLTTDLNDGLLTVAIVLDDVPSFRDQPGQIRFSSREGPVSPFLRVVLVPEPSTFGFLSLMACLVAARRRP